MNEPGMVYWLTGLAGAGKSTIGRLLYAKLLEEKPNVVLLDGDDLRNIFGNDLGYTAADRLISAKRNAKLCEFLAAQGIDTVCCTISMFEEVRVWNRTHNVHYCEVYIKAPFHILRKRNQKGLYTSSSELIVGMGIRMEEPQHPDVVISNDGREEPIKAVERILAWQNKYYDG